MNSQTRQRGCFKPASDLHRWETWKRDLIWPKLSARDGCKQAVSCADRGCVVESDDEVTRQVGTADAQRCIHHIISVKYQSDIFCWTGIGNVDECELGIHGAIGWCNPALLYIAVLILPV